ncbi:cysteine proteinase [Linderina pennispora]|uniref:ubiquitinyl hydrolase 1 n=1 Tax=Linderina pennispora TaxID=61395 RepID=A0A1Y1W052_9FUNG|nr:cysteine proteinase [Linderina pennispora]ORX66882.1 cysteine proteinase [Linderina pennispora]
MSFMKWMSGGSGAGNGSNGSTGTVNVGNTCYASSILQALYFCQTFRDCVNNYPAEKYQIDDSMFASLKDLFWSISTRIQRSGSISPQRFIGKLKECNELFRSNAHQDAHEFLNYLLNEIVENVDKIYRDKKLDGTWVHTLFEGLLTNETKCLSCENVTSRDETLLDVSVDIHENTSVTNCLNQFAAGELLLPQQQRFKYHEGLGRYVKLSYRVNFPTELRVPNTTEETEDLLYSLSAIVVHLGGGPYHGHYISIVRSGNKWILFDDDCVDIIDENELYNYFGNFPKLWLRLCAVL